MNTINSVPLIHDREMEVRRRLSGKRLAVFLDYDGTLTPIVERYDQAVLTDDTRHAVGTLARYCPVAIVSGRDVDVVRGFVRLDEVYYAGSHGFDIRGPDGWSRRLEKGTEFLPAIDEAERTLRSALADIPGHAVERKRFSIAVHYRQVAEADITRVESALDEVLARHPDLQKGRGKQVFRVQPRIDWHKGHAVDWLLEQLSLGAEDVLPVYVGDDVTDEDAFRTLADRGLTVVVRDPQDRPTAAEFSVESPDDVRRFLELLTLLTSREVPKG